MCFFSILGGRVRQVGPVRRGEARGVGRRPGMERRGGGAHESGGGHAGPCDARTFLRESVFVILCSKADNTKNNIRLLL